MEWYFVLRAAAVKLIQEANPKLSPTEVSYFTFTSCLASRWNFMLRYTHFLYRVPFGLLLDVTVIKKNRKVHTGRLAQLLSTSVW